TLQTNFINETKIARLIDDNKNLRLREEALIVEKEALILEKEALILENRELREWKSDVKKGLWHIVNFIVFVSFVKILYNVVF
ncbi:1654_t:CDS:1, partial [Gigaspora margarita]